MTGVFHVFIWGCLQSIHFFSGAEASVDVSRFQVHLFVSVQHSALQKKPGFRPLRYIRKTFYWVWQVSSTAWEGKLLFTLTAQQYCLPDKLTKISFKPGWCQGGFCFSILLALHRHNSPLTLTIHTIHTTWFIFSVCFLCIVFFNTVRKIKDQTEQIEETALFESLQVPIQFWQHGVADIRLHTEVKAGSVLDYACDEPTLPPYLTLTVKGAGSSEVTADMNFFREYNKLYYENFIYIAATHTFSQYGPVIWITYNLILYH